MYNLRDIALIEITNDRRPDFALNPFNGPTPTRDQAFQRFCSENGNRPGCLFRTANELAPWPAEVSRMPRSWQTSFGVARQISPVLAVEVDYVQTNTRNEKVLGHNSNVKFDPVTGENLPYSNINNRIYPDWGVVSTNPMGGWSDYRGVQLAFTKRFSQRWQASGNYLLSKIMDSKPNPVMGLELVTFKVAPDLGEDYARAETDQRHRAVVNGIYQAPFGFQVSGLYFFGNGTAQQITPGTTDIRDLGNNGDYPNRRRLNGEIIPRNNFQGPSVHRVDLRIQQRIPLGGRVRFDAQAEVFNAFNRFNPSSYVTNESNIRFGQPNSSTNLAYAPRVLQLGFRVAF
jgi:hypothetical protein